MSKAEIMSRANGMRPDEGGVDDSLLQAEISFWQEMIKFRDDTMTDESLERMQQALALAQCKLKNSLISSQSSRLSHSSQSGNVIFINGRKV